MRKRKLTHYHTLAGVLVTLAISQCAFAGETLMDKLQRYELDNGMKILVLEDHSSPLVAIYNGVNVGLKNEDYLTNGLSHFLEHLVFKGTAKHSVEELNRIAEKEGGYYNAYTWYDFTAFELVVPSYQFEEAMELQSDILLNSIFPLEELERERKVVLEEIKQCLDDPVDVRFDLVTDKLYKDSPYARTILGSANIVNTVTRNEIIKYYKTYYYPGNMILVIVGDVNAEQARLAAQKYYGDAPPRQTPNVDYPPLPIFTERSDLEAQLDIEEAYFSLNYHGPELSAKDYIALDLAWYWLVNGESSLLYEELVNKSGLVTDIDGDIWALLNRSSWINIEGSCPPENLEAVKTKILEELAKLSERKLDQETLEKLKNKAMADYIFDGEAFHSRADRLLYYAMHSALHVLDHYPKSLKSLKTNDIEKALKAFVLDKHGVWAAVKPKNTPTPTPTANPDASPTPTALPTLEIREIKNGLKVIAREDTSANMISTVILIGGGVSSEPSGRNGLGNLTIKLLSRGTKSLSGNEISDKIDRLGLHYETQLNNDYYALSVKATTDKLSEALELLSQMLHKPTFPQEEIENKIQQIKGEIRAENDDMFDLAHHLFLDTLIPTHPYKRRLIGDESRLDRLSRRDITRYADAILVPANLIVSVTGNKPAAELANLVEEHFEKLNKKILELPDLKMVSDDAAKTLGIKTLEKEQVVLNIGINAPRRAHKDYPSCILLKEILNGLSPMRLWRLREELGLAYWIGAEYTALKKGGWFYVEAGTSPENANKILQEIRYELKKIATELVTDDELEAARRKYIGKYLRHHSTMTSKALSMAVNEYFGFGWNFFDKFKPVLERQTSQDIYVLAKSLFEGRELTVSIVGPLEDKDLKQAGN